MNLKKRNNLPIGLKLLVTSRHSLKGLKNHQKKGLKCDQIGSKSYSWHNPKAQVDLVIDREDAVVNLCEIKFYNDEFSLDAPYLQRLRNKENQFRASTKTKKGIYTVLISTWGVNPNQYSQAIVTNSLTMKCLFEPM